VKLAVAVDRGTEITTLIEKLKTELDACEEIILAAALLGDHVDLVDPERGGKQYIAHGKLGTVPVVFTSDLIAASFGEDSIAHNRAKAVAGDKLSDLYKRKVNFELISKSGLAFRREVAAAFDAATAPQVITACLSRGKDGVPKSQTKIEWDRATSTPQEAE